MNQTGTRYHIGIGGWEHDVLDRCFYPTAGLSSARKLEIYARYFDTTEIRPTFWDDSLGAEDAREWAEAVEARSDFRFIVKAHSSLTHTRTLTAPVVRSFSALLLELQQANRLGAVLAQFPYAFTNTGANRFHLEKLAAALKGFPVHIELRHASWEGPTFASFLQELGLSSVHADLPRIRQFPVTLPRPHGERAYFRLHGRNEKGWLLNGYDVRYDYLYNARELRELKRRMVTTPLECRDAFIIMNNTTGGKAIANAFEMLSALHDGCSIPIPAAALQAFPQLAPLARPQTGMGSLFEESYRSAG
jgi:uncharacterized protein YecE (DUF72 family)